MTPDKRRQVEQLYEAALDLDARERRPFVRARCEGDPELQREVESLLDHGDRAGDFLDQSALAVLAAVVRAGDRRSMAGRSIGNYEILSLIGRGGMGEVWRARDAVLGREVAIKMLPEEFSRDRERMARLEREAQVLASLNHPGIAAIYGFEEHDGIRCLILEYVEGETLAARLKRGAIPVKESLKIVAQVAEALETAHEKGVIHRDLKPANIVVTPEGTTKLLDFGLAKALENPAAEVSLASSLSPTAGLSGLSMDGMILGTAAYMSPEQARGVAVDKRTDIWAVGCVLYELLAGRRAFDGEMISDVLASVLARAPDTGPLERYDPALGRLVRRCLEKDPRQRLRDAGDIRIELNHLVSGPADTLNPPLGILQPGKLAVAVALLAGVVLLLAGGGVGWMLRDPPRSGSARFVVSAPPSRPVRLSGLTTDLAISPDGQRIVYSIDESGHRDLYIRPLDQLGGMTLSLEAVDTPFFSPDGAWIGFSALADGVLRRMPVGGGAASTIADLPGAARGASWGPDEVIVVATVDASTGLLEVPARGGSLTVLTTPAPGEDHLWPDVLPGGRAVLFTIRSGLGRANSRVAVLDRDTGDYRVLVEGAGASRYVTTGHIVYGAEGRLLAAPFDLTTLAITGDSALVLEGLVPPESGATPFDVADNGTLAYVSGAPLGNRILAFVGRNGRISPLDLPPKPYLSPRLSPDQRRIAVQVDEPNGRSSIWIYDLSGDVQIKELTQDGNSVRPEWTRDSGRITFASDRNGPWGIYIQPADGSAAARRLTTASDGRTHWPESWSPDGSTLAFTEVDGEARGIWLLSVDGDQVRTESFYDAPGFHQNGSTFSPDGEWLAYYSNESNIDNQVYVQAVPASDVKHRITLNSGVFPLWSADGRELFYRRAGAAAIEGTQLIAVDLGNGGNFSVGAERPLPITGFSVVGTYRDYDISADGQQFLMVFPEDYAEPPGAPSRQVNVVLNWIDELIERVPNP
jgi:serine/threonine-protein kinase